MGFTQENIISTINKQGVIAIIRGVDSENLNPLLDALYNGGLRVAELTFGDNDSLTCTLLKQAISYMGDKMIIGAGTVTDITRAKLARECGAGFAVSPNTNVEVFSYCKQKGMVVVGGAFTPTEVELAHRNGAHFVKIFPVDMFGEKYVKALKGPFKNIPLIVFSGVTTNNIASYIKAGAVGAGVGSELINLEQIKKGNFDYVTKKAEELLEKVSQAKN